MTVIELLDGLISDMSDYLDDYRSDLELADTRIKEQELKIRIDEVKKWRKMLQIIREEQN